MFQGWSQISRDKTAQVNTKAGRWNENHMQKESGWEMVKRNTEALEYAAKHKSQVTLRSMTLITISCEVVDCVSKADPQMYLNEVSFTVKYLCIPSLLFETSIWEQPMVEVS